ncbi:MAG: DEAD/DEAH box helicase family protein, partial [Bacteroidaceae bacterium]|nr:DEAD/DEAH box helicase family protein [Bacteroidales bacterium]MCF0185362.1 DEAD/DEAH box helicase family protein [Bacteroidaceae bacterium]
GSLVAVNFSGREYVGVVSKVHGGEYSPDPLVKPIERVEAEFPSITDEELLLWRQLSDYYLCPIGLVFRAAEKSLFETKTSRRKKESAEAVEISLPPLSEAQQKATEEIRGQFKLSSRPVLLKGVTASGKTHIYMELAKEVLEQGKSVLYLASELAYSSQLHTRLEEAFGKEIVQAFNSLSTPAKRRDVIKRLREGKPTLVLGSKSAVFLPYRNLALIIVDEENDDSYKSRQGLYYNGRDAAIFLAQIHKANIVLGTATPSLETLYNVQKGKFSQVCLNEKFYQDSHTELEIIDTEAEWSKFGMHGSYSRKLATHITKTLSSGSQAIILRTWKNTRKATETTGAKTLEEETRELWPEARIAWIDNSLSDGAIQEIISKFAAGEIDILLGNRIISKGFDFSNVTLVALLGADSITGREDFRCDEQAFATIIHLWGRCARHSEKGLFVIQTKTSAHPVLQALEEDASVNDIERHLLEERLEFAYPPYTRLVDIKIKDKDGLRLDAMGNLLRQDIALGLKGIKIIGPYTSASLSADEKSAKIIRIFLPKDRTLGQNKIFLAKIVKDFESLRKYVNHITIDVDPL